MVCIALVQSSFAQAPKLAYMIPDIGTPGMNTYVEFIADVNANGTFGTDNDGNNKQNEVYLNNVGDRIRVKCTNPLDSNKVIIGPIIVSSQGRVIATQIFIHPKLKAPNLYPNSWDWRQLRKEFRIPIHVEVNGIASPSDTFYIVRPFEVDPSKLGDRVLGQGSLGIRSPRGAMLLGYDDPLKDSYNVFLGSGTYTVSVNDCDPYRAGNQGYLPYTLLVKGFLQGAVGSTTISVDANGKNGGPGGGGGGGGYCDWPASELGELPGTGFTSGGLGGKNGVRIVRDERTQPVSGSGSVDGKSLNGVEGGVLIPSFENAGGGTGHPFGKSGSASYGNIGEVGGYGGGSGESQLQKGGSGGFGTNGEGVNQSFGKVVGNKCLVPVAGGSGGASGNPQAVFPFPDCSGVGGGGGGAIKIFAYQISEVHLSAKGADGSNEVPEGGSGSGGSITMQAKTALNNVSTDFVGGGLGNNNVPDGGEGRVRYDAETITQVPIGSSVFRGLRTDRIDVVPRTFLYKGISGNTYTRVFFKPEGKSWREYNDMPSGSPDAWTVTIDLKDRNAYPERIFFLVATQIIAGNVQSGFTSEPVRIMSQAAADIAQLREAPIAIVDDTIRLKSILCPGDNQPKQGRIWNEGGEELKINNTYFRKGNQGFSFVVDKLKIAPNDTGRVTFTWQLPTGSTQLDFEDELIIETNDPDPTRSIVYMKVFIHRDTIDIRIVDNQVSNTEITTVNLGTSCIGAPVKKTVYFKNRSSVDINLVQVFIEDASNFSINYTIPSPFKPDMIMPIEIIFMAKSKGQLQTRLIIKTNECNRENVLSIDANGIETQLEFSGTGQFNDVRVGETAQLTVVLTNKGSAEASLPPSFFPVNTPFRIVSTTPQLPTVLLPLQQLFVTIEYSPLSETKDSAVLGISSLLTSSSCVDTAKLLIAGKSYRSNITTSKSSIDYGMVNHCDNKDDTLYLYNRGGNDIRFDSIAIISGTNPNAFVITEQPPIPSTVKSGDSVRYIIRYNSDEAENDLNTAILIIYTNDKDFSTITRPISVVRERMKLNIPPYILIPQQIVGTIASTQVNPRNNENETVLINTIFSKSGNTVTPNQLNISSGMDGQIQYSIPIKKSGSNIDTMVLCITKPCIDTQYVVVECIGVVAEAKQNNRLDFGSIEFCEEKIDSVILSNTGQVNITVNSMEIVGSDKQFFQFVNSMTFPATLLPQTRIVRQVRFFPTITTDGAKSAFVESDVSIGGTNKLFSTNLYGERTSTLLSAPEISVLKVEEQSRIEDRLTLRNTGNKTIRIEKTDWKNKFPDLSIVPELPYTIPADVLPNEEISFRVIFTPQSVVRREDTLLFNVSSPCVEERHIPVIAVSIPTVRTFIYLPIDPKVNPRATNYSIPITMRMTPVNAVLENVGFRAEILLDERIFFPKRTTIGSMTVTKEPNSKKNKIVVQGDGITVSNNNAVITEIIGDALLGSIESDSIRWGENGFRWTRGTSARVDSIKNGFLQSVLCEEGGKRMLYDSVVTLASLIVTPNPIMEDIVSINLNSTELGAYSVVVTSINGEKMFEQRWDKQVLSSEEVVTKVSTERWANGMYFITVHLPSNTLQKSITILR